MNLLSLSWAYIRTQPVSTVLTLLLLTLGVGTIVVLLLFSRQMEDRLGRDLRGIDLVVGAKGSPLQLVLAAVYHLDVPTGNVTREQARVVSEHEMVAQAIPLALGDSVAGFRIVGTTHDYVQHYEAAPADGRLWQETLEVVLGAEAARGLRAGVGDSFEGAHGVSGGGSLHAGHSYRVVGVLRPTGTVVDRLVLTGIDSVEKVHEGQGGRSPSGAYRLGAGMGGSAAGRELTALLIRYRSPLAAVSLPRFVNAQTALQAAAPAFETARLMRLVGIGADAFRLFAYALILAAALSTFLTLYTALKARQYDLAIMRASGASRRLLLSQILLEGVLLSLGGTLLGIAFGHLATEALAAWLRSTQQVPFSGGQWLWEEALLLLLAVLLGVAAALLPALRAYRIDVARLLARG